MEKDRYNPFESYSRSKLANAIYANYLSKSLASFGILTASVHPGVIHTELFRFPGFFSVSIVNSFSDLAMVIYVAPSYQLKISRFEVCIFTKFSFT